MATAPLKKAQISEYYMDLDQNDQILVEYVWIGGTGLDLRCKTKTIVGKEVNSIDDLPDWNFDGSSTGQAPGNDSEIILKPVALFKDPFRRGKNKLCLCACYKPDGTPAIASNYEACLKVMERAKAEKPWFGIEQEYTLLAWPSLHPLGWPQGGFPAPQGPYYCSVGAPVNFGRPIVETHYRACLYAGVKMSGINAEVMPGQWEFQVGPCEGIDMGNHLWIARYILHRVAEQFGVVVSLEPKPIVGDWNGAGCHTNVSTLAMREDGGIKHIESAIEKLSKKHKEHIACYGEGNEKRLTGHHETASMAVFKSGVGDRGASIRVPVQCKKDGKGYFEDRRPASNIDPYVVTSRIVRTICLDE